MASGLLYVGGAARAKRRGKGGASGSLHSSTEVNTRDGAPGG